MENSYIWGKNAISKIGNKKKTAECRTRQNYHTDVSGLFDLIFLGEGGVS